MAVTAKTYGQFMMALATKKINMSTDTFKVMLLTNAYVPNQDTHAVKADIDALGVETSGTNYTAGGQALAGVTLTYDAATNNLKFDANDTIWATSTITAKFAVIYDDTATNKDLVCFLDFGQDMVSSNGNFPITWDSLGILNLSTPA